LVLAFASKPLRETCEIEAHAKRRLSSKAADSLKHRLADLEAAASVEDLIVGSPRKRKASDTYIVNLADGFCLEFAANHIKNPIHGEGKVDWGKVSRIQILSIGKCND
jgi:hypothetical protein